MALMARKKYRESLRCDVAHFVVATIFSEMKYVFLYKFETNHFYSSDSFCALLIKLCDIQCYRITYTIKIAFTSSHRLFYK